MIDSSRPVDALVSFTVRNSGEGHGRIGRPLGSVRLVLTHKCFLTDARGASGAHHRGFALSPYRRRPVRGLYGYLGKSTVVVVMGGRSRCSRDALKSGNKVTRGQSCSAVEIHPLSPRRPDTGRRCASRTRGCTTATASLTCRNRLWAFRGRRHDLVRKPDAGEPHVRFDERGFGNAVTGAGLRPGAKATD